MLLVAMDAQQKRDMKWAKIRLLPPSSRSFLCAISLPDSGFRSDFRERLKWPIADWRLKSFGASIADIDYRMIGMIL
jgi:hypothetical protein